MERGAMADLIRWKDRKGRMPLVIKGVRQCGKTFLVKEFGTRCFDDIMCIDLERQRSYHSVFQGNLDPHWIVNQLEASEGKKIIPGKTLLFIDEIQACPEALTALKYFSEDAPEIHVVAARSLLGVKLSMKSSYPLGKVDTLTLRPMDFREWLIATGEQGVVDLIERDGPFSVSEPVLSKLEMSFREYMFVGGMPKVVETWIETRDQEAVRNEQERILDRYDSDFLKHVPEGDGFDVSTIWEAIPTTLSNENSKFIFSSLRGSKRASDYERAMKWLQDAGLVYKVNANRSSSIPLSAGEDKTSFKLYMCDIGLLSYKTGMDLTYYTNEEIRSNLNPIYRGASAENFVNNELASSGFITNYWRDGRYEVDFIIAKPGMTSVVPIEVKSGWKVRATSLKKYIDTFSPEKSIILSMNPPSEGDVVKLPIYLAWMVPKMIEQED